MGSRRRRGRTGGPGRGPGAQPGGGVIGGVGGAQPGGGGIGGIGGVQPGGGACIQGGGGSDVRTVRSAGDLCMGLLGDQVRGHPGPERMAVSEPVNPQDV